MSKPVRMEGKYVIVSNMGFESPILFGLEITHKRFKELRPVRAGFFSIDGCGVQTYGKSDSLKLESNPEMDTSLIRCSFRMNRDY